MMRALLLAFLAAAPQRGHAACKDHDALHLREGVTKARELASSCLVNAGLNPRAGKRILAADKAVFRCDYDIKNQAQTTRRDSLSPDVAVDVSLARPDAETCRALPRPLDLTLFHELLHVADPDDDAVFSSASHNRGLGFPDGIYGCEYACAGEIDPGSYGRAYMLLFEGLVRPLPEDGGYVCPTGAGADCATLKKYAWLCRNGAPSLSREERRGLRVLEIALCMRQSFLDLLVPKTDHPLAKETFLALVDAQKAKDDRELERARLIANFSRVVAHAMDADWRERLWFAQFLSRNDCPALP